MRCGLLLICLCIFRLLVLIRLDVSSICIICFGGCCVIGVSLCGCLILLWFCLVLECR